MPESAQNGSAIIIDIPEERDHFTLRNFGIGTAREGRVWCSRRRNVSAFLDLLNGTQSLDILCENISQCGVAVQSSTASLTEYFGRIDALIESELAESGRLTLNSRSVAIVNLLPFCLSISRADKIIGGLFFQRRSPVLSRFSAVVLFVRKGFWFLKSKRFRQLRSVFKDLKIATVDHEGHLFVATGEAVGEHEEFDRGVFARFLNLERASLYRALISQTNSFIGHFVLPNSHVRTHYDVREFVERDDIGEYMLARILSLIGEEDSVLMLGIGIEEEAVWRLANRVRTVVGERKRIDFVFVGASVGKEGVPVDWHREYDVALVLTDIVNSGNSASALVEVLQNTREKPPPIRAFSVACMSNSPRELRGVPLTTGIRIQRTYFENDSKKCRLCQIEQPKQVVNRLEDFQYVSSEQFTPFDFWEMVQESGALESRKLDSQQRRLLLRIEVGMICKRYSGWLRNVIRQRFSEIWPNNSPSIIITVNEPSSVAFASLVNDALGANHFEAVERNTLRRITGSGALPPGLGRLFERSGDALRRVLIVDDGINRGGTMKSLFGLCKAVDVMPMGAFVFDSRLDAASELGLRRLISLNPICALYTWPAGRNF